jgi:DNA-binding NarL/FixJ family response regulator
MKHIAIAEDNPASILKVIDCLKRTGDFSVEIIASNGYELIEQLHFASHDPDIFITDINMPVMDGIAVNFYLSQYYPLSKIISISVYFDYAIMQQAVESGAQGYLVKPEAETVILEAIKEVQNNSIYLDSRAKIDENSKARILSASQAYNVEPLIGLTKREKLFVMLNATTLSYEQIAKLMFVELKTVQTYFDRVAKKCNVNSRQALTLFSLQNGLARVARYRPEVQYDKT